MNSSCFLSVIIPVYNCESRLTQCVDSILAADVENMELILIDDGSTDGSGKVCSYYVSNYPNVRYYQQANSGPSAARNRGLNLARGEYIAFVDSDDYIDPSAFEENLRLLRQQEADIWATDFSRVADNGCVLDKVYQIEAASDPLTGRAYLPHFLAAKDCVWNVWRYIFRREFIEKNNLRFSEGFSIAEDLEFVVKAFGLCDAPAFFHEPYYFYRVNYGDSLTRRHSAERLRQFVCMLKSARDSLGADETAQLIKAKLAREYILNLSALYEVPRGERRAALAELEKGKRLMDGASGVYAPASKVIKIVGIRISALGLLTMKRAKRLIRAIKAQRFDRRK